MERKYTVKLGSGTRTVKASCKLEAVCKATFSDASRFAQTSESQFTDTASNPGHRSVYTVELLVEP